MYRYENLDAGEVFYNVLSRSYLHYNRWEILASGVVTLFLLLDCWEGNLRWRTVFNFEYYPNKTDGPQLFLCKLLKMCLVIYCSRDVVFQLMGLFNYTFVRKTFTWYITYYIFHSSEFYNWFPPSKGSKLYNRIVTSFAYI